jgi:hypothetical protein
MNRKSIAEDQERLAKELYASMVADLDAGRLDAAVVHFRSLGEACFRGVYAAKFASDKDVKRGAIRGEINGVGKLWVEALRTKGLPVEHAESLVKKFKDMWSKFSQAEHAHAEMVKSLRQHTLRSRNEFYGRDLSRLEEEAMFLIGLATMAAQGTLP